MHDVNALLKPSHVKSVTVVLEAVSRSGRPPHKVDITLCGGICLRHRVTGVRTQGRRRKAQKTNKFTTAQEAEVAAVGIEPTTQGL